MVYGGGTVMAGTDVHTIGCMTYDDITITTDVHYDTMYYVATVYCIRLHTGWPGEGAEATPASCTPSPRQHGEEAARVGRVVVVGTYGMVCTCVLVVAGRTPPDHQSVV